jgi:hypothetical protein
MKPLRISQSQEDFYDDLVFDQWLYSQQHTWCQYEVEQQDQDQLHTQDIARITNGTDFVGASTAEDQVQSS